jgi:YHS domain-containing protein
MRDTNEQNSKLCQCGAPSPRGGRCRECKLQWRRERYRKLNTGAKPQFHAARPEKCIECKENPIGAKSRLGLCIICNEKHRLARISKWSKSRYQPVPKSKVCKCGCGKLTRAGKFYTFASDECRKQFNRKGPPRAKRGAKPMVAPATFRQESAPKPKPAEFVHIDTPAERRRVAELLEKAARERVTLGGLDRLSEPRFYRPAGWR